MGLEEQSAVHFPTLFPSWVRKNIFCCLGLLEKMKMFPNRGLLPDCMGLMGTSVPKLHRGIACAALHVTDCMCKIALASA